MYYRFGLINKAMTNEAVEHNRSILGPHTLGVEVTTDAFAEQCGLGNIDPQHRGARDSSAIESALLYEPLPPEGSILVTERRDKDSIGAMAVLTRRAMGTAAKLNRELVAWVGMLDRESGAAKGNGTFHAEMFKHSSEAEAMDILAHDRNSPLIEAVLKSGYILCGEARDEVQRLVASRAKKVVPDFKSMFSMYGKVAFIDAPGSYHDARNWGNRRFAVVVVRDLIAKRWTIARQAGCFDRNGCEADLRMEEAKVRGITPEELKVGGLECGGAGFNISSPAGEGRESKLGILTVIQLAVKHYESGIVS